MPETYLYTGEAIKRYLQHVNENGYLSITRWIKIPPRDEPKLLATVINALKQVNAGQPGLQMVMIRSWQTSTLIIKNGVISLEEIKRLFGINCGLIAGDTRQCIADSLSTLVVERQTGNHPWLKNPSAHADVFFLSGPGALMGAPPSSAPYWQL